MKIKINNFKLSEKGVYQFKNLVNSKLYIGSTIMTFEKRFYHHLSMLRANKHKNKYLQHSFNKYGEENFEFSIIEVCTKENCLLKEQYWINTLEVIDKNKGYNINPLASGTPNMSKETIEKRRQTMLRRFANGELDHLKEICRQNALKVKGKKILNTEHLKVPKTITPKVISSRIERLNRNRKNKFPDIHVYDINMNYLGTWRSSIDLEEWSLINNTLPFKSRFKSGKSGNPINILKSSNIQFSCKTGKPYKNLYFSYKPLHQVTDVEKLDKFGETPAMDNTEPTTNLND
jgi:group I intron endonuclease